MKPLEKEFLNIITDYQGILHKVNLLYFRNEEDRKDNFQEVISQLWQSYPRLRNKDSFGSWIYRIAINTSITKIKKETRIIYDDSSPELISEPDCSERIAKTEDEKVLLSSIQRLEGVDRAIFLLYLEDKSYVEISEIIGISVSNVGVRINRAKVKVQQILKKLNYER